ncbi:unnamed protein product [Moneuplotes crassus]|uniref:Uncharacterized protein n=1 Tax=Euplotes crassus TaxID=5936 RepID=A0AAD1YBB3_EUPCR|nr:unnamed protein product [Moneuplotes crassus]
MSLLPLLFLLSLFPCFFSKQTLLEGLSELDKVMDLYEGITKDHDQLQAQTIDGQILAEVYSAILEKGNCTSDEEFMRKGCEQLRNVGTKDRNLRAMQYFGYVQSLVVEEVENPFGDVFPDFEEFKPDHRSVIIIDENLDYLELMNFWRQYTCLSYKNASKEYREIQNSYMELLKYLLPYNTTDDKHLLPFEIFNQDCQCSLKNIISSLNPAHSGYLYFYSKLGVTAQQPLIRDETETDLDFDHYYSKEDIERATRIKQIKINIEKGINDTVIDGVDVNQTKSVSVNPQPTDNIQENISSENHEINTDGVNQEIQGTSQPEAFGEVHEGPHPNPNPVNYPFRIPNLFNNIGEFFNRWSPFEYLSSTKLFSRFFRKNSFQRDEDDSEESTKMNLIINQAFKSNSSLLFYNIGNIYFSGNTEFGVIKNIEKARKYYKLAADMDNPLAIYNLGILAIQKNASYSLQMFERCAKPNFSSCYIGQGKIYSNQGFSERNLTKAVESFEKGLELGDFEGASNLSELYFNELDIKNDTKALEYLDIAINNTDSPGPKLLRIIKYLENSASIEDPGNCEKAYNLIKNLIEIGEINEWYFYGYKKYTTGKFDQALQLFSFASMNGHKLATLAAAYIWEHNLTQNLTCRLGHHSLCSFVYNMHSFFLGDKFAGLRATRVITSLNTKINVSENAQIKANELYFQILEHLSEDIPEAKFNKASLIVATSPDKIDEADDIWDSMIYDSWNGKIDIKNLAPAVLSKLYHHAKLYMYAETS